MLSYIGVYQNIFCLGYCRLSYRYQGIDVLHTGGIGLRLLHEVVRVRVRVYVFFVWPFVMCFVACILYDNPRCVLGISAGVGGALGFSFVFLLVVFLRFRHGV